jgi:hypothetical protein
MEQLSGICTFILHQPLTETDDASGEAWQDLMEETFAYTVEPHLEAQEGIEARSALNTITDAFLELVEGVHAKKCEHGVWNYAHRSFRINALLNKPQVEQRTEAWYAESTQVLSASQFHTILTPGLTRGRLVMEKAFPPPPQNRRTVVFTEDLMPFTWGIRFEPLVKMLYEYVTHTKVAELGRLRHTSVERLAASPDGLVVQGPFPRYGRFVEFKAPVSRTLNKVVPAEYYTQMQIQMEVGDVEECDYLEVKFQSRYGQKIPPVPTEQPAFYGTLFVISHLETNEPIRYIYGPLNDSNWTPDPATLQPHEQVAETVPWWVQDYWLETVPRSRTWFEKTLEPFVKFWEDVALAKENKFVLPPSSRKPREQKCQIVMETD